MTTIKVISSPNYSQRSSGIATVKGGLVHWTGSTAGAEAIAYYFKNPYVDVSSHAVIGRDALIVRCVHPKYKAWHAGPSKFDFNRDGTLAAWEYGLNDSTVGWELCHMPGQDWPEKQIKALVHEIKYANRVCPNFKYRYIIDHEAASHALTGKWDVDETFPAYKMFWWLINGIDSDPPKGFIDKLPDWAVRQAKIIKREY